MADNREIVYRYGQEGLEDLQRKLLEMAGAAQQAAKQISDGAKPASAGLKAIDEAAKQAKGVVDEFANRAGAAGAIISRLGPWGLAGAAGIGAVTAALSFSIREAAQAEREMKKIEGVLNAQGAAARVSAGEIERYAEAVASTTMAMEADLKSAAAQLLAFRGIAGSTFEETLKAAQDLAAAGFGSLSTNATALAKALNDPLNEVQALQKAFPALTDEQVKSIKATAEQNGVYAAQQKILASVRDTIGGAGANEADTLIGAWKLLKQEIGEAGEGAGGWFLRDITSAVRGAATKLRRAREGNQLDDVFVIHGEVVTGADMRAMLANTQAFLAASERDVELARERGLESLKSFQETRKDVEARDADERKAIADKNAKEEKARQDALWDQQLADYRNALANMRKAAEDALKNEDVKFNLLPQVEDWLAGEQKAADRIKTINDEMWRDIHRTMTSTFEDALNGNLRSFEDFAASIKNIGVRMFSNMMAEQAQKWMMQNLSNGAMQGLGAGAAGYALGSSFGVRQGPGNEIGGLVGGGAGYALGGPFGAFVGSTIGSFLGGQFGPRPTDGTETVTRELYTGRRWENDLGRGKDSPENRAAVNAFDTAIQAFIETLKSSGLAPTASSYMLEVGYGNSQDPFRASVSGGAVRGFSSQADAFRWIADKLVDSLAEVPARLQQLVDDFDPSNIEAFFTGLQRVQNFEATIAGVKDDLLKLTDPEAWETKQVTDWFNAIQQEAIDLGYDITGAIFDPVIALRDQQLAGIAGRFHPVTPGGSTPVAPPPEATANWQSIIGGLYDRRIDQLQEEAAALRESATAWERAGNAIKQTRASLLIDPNLSPLSLEARRSEAFSQLQAAYGKASAGDADAAAQLPDLARAALTASREFYRSSEAYYDDFNRVQNLLGAAQTYAQQQTDIAHQSLNVQMAILETLQSQRGGLGSSGARPSYNAADVANITTEFQAAWQRSGLSRGEFLASDEGQNIWLPIRQQWIAGISDENQLKASLGAARSQKNEGGYASSDAVLFEQQVTNRMRELGFDVPSMAVGGMVRRTGLVYAHQGEHITPAGNMSGIEKTVANLAAQVASLTSVMAEAETRSLALLGEIADSNQAMMQSESVAALNARLAGRGKVSR